MLRTIIRSVKPLTFIYPQRLVSATFTKPLLPIRALSQAAKVPSVGMKNNQKSIYCHPEPFKTLLANSAKSGFSSDKVNKMILENKVHEANQLNKFFERSYAYPRKQVYLEKLCEQNRDTLAKIFNIMMDKEIEFLIEFDDIRYAFQNHIVKASDTHSVVASMEKFISAVKHIKSLEIQLRGPLLDVVEILVKNDLFGKLLACNDIQSVLQLCLRVAYEYWGLIQMSYYDPSISYVQGNIYKAIFENESLAPKILQCLDDDYVRRCRQLSGQDGQFVKRTDSALLRTLIEKMSKVPQDLNEQQAAPKNTKDEFDLLRLFSHPKKTPEEIENSPEKSNFKYFVI